MTNQTLDWMGLLPSHWEKLPIRSLMIESSQKNLGAINQNYLSLMATVGVLPYAEKGAVGNKAPEDLSKCKLVQVGDFVLNSMNFAIGSFGVSSYDGVCSPVYLVLRPRDNVDPRFLKYIFSLRPFQKLAQSFGNGILEHRAAIGWQDLKNLRLPFPPIEEQKAIADFLDRELNTLDSAIACQEKLVGLLIERRLATIQAAMQESTHLTGSVTAPLKWHARLRTGGTPSDAEYTAETADGVPWLRPDDLDESGNPSRGTRFFDKTSLAGIGMATPGSILLCCIGATLGKAGIVQENVAFNQQITSITSSLNPRFLHYQLVTKKQDLKNLSMGNTLPILNNDRLGSLKIVIPTAENQASVASFLDVQTSSMDIAIQKARDLVSVLTERRQALISAAVTGKIDVRGNS